MLKKFLLILVLCFCSEVRAEDMSIYQAEVEVDATAADAALAREKALAEANRKALYAVTNRISTASSTQILDDLNDNQILNFIQEVSVTSEKVLGSRYLASLKLTVNAPILKAYLAEKNAPISILPESHFSIIPVYRESEVSTPLLWEDANIWYQTWADNSMESGQITIRPLAKTKENQKILQADEALRLNGQILDTIKRQNDGNDLYIADAVIIGNALNTTLKSPIHGIIDSKKYTDAKPETFEQAVQDMKSSIMQQIQQKALTDSQKPNKMTIVYHFETLKEWLHLRQQLKSFSSIQMINIDAMSGHTAQLTLEYIGSNDDILNEFAKHGFDIKDTGNLYELEGRQDGNR